MKVTKEQIVMTKEQVKDIATKAANKAVEMHKNMTTEDKTLCIAAAAAVIATLTAIKVACIAKKTKKGTYKIKVRIMSTGNATYKASDWKTVTVTVKVK